jgi:hypothetical protein
MTLDTATGICHPTRNNNMAIDSVSTAVPTPVTADRSAWRAGFGSARDVAAPRKITDPDAKTIELREAFTSFVGRTFFSQLIHAMRSSVGKPAYFHGGQAEEIFRGELDRILGEKMARQSGPKLADPMFHQQFPRQAARDRVDDRSMNDGQAGVAGTAPPGFDSLDILRRR